MEISWLILGVLILIIMGASIRRNVRVFCFCMGVGFWYGLWLNMAAAFIVALVYTSVYIVLTFFGIWLWEDY